MTPYDRLNLALQNHLSLKLSDACNCLTGGGGGGAFLFFCLPADWADEARLGVDDMMRLLCRRTGEKPRSGERSPPLPLMRDPLLELEAPALC